MATLSRATLLADRYGAGAYGKISAAAGAATTTARAAAPVAAAAYAGAVGYHALMWTLAALALGAAILAVLADRRSDAFPAALPS